MSKRSRKEINVNWEEFDKLVSYQCTQIELADFFGCSVDYLDDLCIEERGMSLADIWHKKKSLGRVRLRKAQLDNVERGAPGWAAMAIWLDKKMMPEENPDLYVLPPKPVISIFSTSKEVKPEPVSFEQFCENAKYPKPFEKQIEMVKFGMEETEPRMILGARGYGKTDYITALGSAYYIYLDWFRFKYLGQERITETNLVITKSMIRNTAICEEVANALKANGVPLEKENAKVIRVDGIIGKDHSFEAITIKTSMRGRHPKRTIMDDPVTEEDVSEATRLVVQRKYNEILKLCDNVLIIGQPAHKFDLYASLRELVKKMEVPHGTIPELDHDLEAQRLAGVDEASIQASYFLTIKNEGSIPFDQVKYIDQLPYGDSVAFIDPSHEGGDYTAITILKGYMQGVAVQGHVWKMAWNHCIDKMIPIIKELGVRKLAFETNALGDQPILMLRQALDGTGIGVVGIRSNTNKHSRIMAAGSYSHLIHLSKKSDKLYTNQVIQYEYKAKNDDAPDSLASLLQWVGLIKGKE